MFIGPPADAIDAMGSKTRARELMSGRRRADRAGHHRAGRDASRTPRKMIEADIGYPVAVKAAGGGGGKGFRVALSEDELEEAFEGAAREGEKFFSDATVYLERYLPDPRHVEVQVLADARRQRHPPRRARLLGAAPPPEADRGVPRPGRRRRAARAHRADRHRGGPRGGLPLRRHDRGPAGRRRVLLPRDEHARAGRALRDRDDDRDRHRPRAGADRRRRAAVVRAGGRRAARPRDRVPHQRRGRRQELRARPGADRRPTASRPGPACASTPASPRARRSRRCTTRWSPS